VTEVRHLIVAVVEDAWDEQHLQANIRALSAVSDSRYQSLVLVDLSGSLVHASSARILADKGVSANQAFDMFTAEVSRRVSDALRDRDLRQGAVDLLVLLDQHIKDLMGVRQVEGYRGALARVLGLGADSPGMVGLAGAVAESRRFGHYSGGWAVFGVLHDIMSNLFGGRLANVAPILATGADEHFFGHAGAQGFVGTYPNYCWRKNWYWLWSEARPITLTQVCESIDRPPFTRLKKFELNTTTLPRLLRDIKWNPPDWSDLISASVTLLERNASERRPDLYAETVDLIDADDFHIDGEQPREVEDFARKYPLSFSLASRVVAHSCFNRPNAGAELTTTMRMLYSDRLTDGEFEKSAGKVLNLLCGPVAHRRGCTIHVELSGYPSWSPDGIIAPFLATWNLVDSLLSGEGARITISDLGVKVEMPALGGTVAEDQAVIQRWYRKERDDPKFNVDEIFRCRTQPRLRKVLALFKVRFDLELFFGDGEEVCLMLQRSAPARSS